MDFLAFADLLAFVDTLTLGALLGFDDLPGFVEVAVTEVVGPPDVVVEPRVESDVVGVAVRGVVAVGREGTTEGADVRVGVSVGAGGVVGDDDGAPERDGELPCVPPVGERTGRDVDAGAGA